MFPIDIVKTRMQIQGEYSSRNRKAFHKSKKRGMFSTATSIVKREGMFGLWAGLSPAMLRNCLITRIAIYELLKNHVIQKDSNGNFPVWQGTMASFCAGSVGKLLHVPFDSTKTEMQMQGSRAAFLRAARKNSKGKPRKYKKLTDVLVSRYKIGGVRALWKGTVPSVTRAGLMNLADMSTYDNCKRFLIRRFGFRDAIPLHFACGIVAGFAVAVVATPVDVIKARMMNQPLDKKTGKGMYYKGTMDCLRKTVGHEGAKSLYKGFTPFWIRIGPSVVIVWVVVEYLRTIFDLEGF